MNVPIHSNAQRQSAITGMTLTELKKEGNWEKQTGRSSSFNTIKLVCPKVLDLDHYVNFGFIFTGQAKSAVLVCNSVLVEMLVMWERLVSRSLDSHLAFPAYNGETIAHLERKVSGAAKAPGAHSPNSHCIPQGSRVEEQAPTGTSEGGCVPCPFPFSRDGGTILSGADAEGLLLHLQFNIADHTG